MGAIAIVSAIVAFGAGTGFVREHCFDWVAGARTHSAVVESQWTMRTSPPSVLAAQDGIDGAKVCVRNTPLREGLAAVGVWDLGSPEDQLSALARNRLRDAGEAP
jgi:hypothetical protein